MYASNGPLNDNDRDKTGKLNIHLIPIFHSTDLVNWNYVGDVFQKRPKWIGESKLIGPEIQSHDGKYFLYYTAVDEDEQGNKRNGGAIGVATSASPTGPWTDSGKPVVEVQNGRWVYDPFVIADESESARGQRYLFYGSYADGLFARKLSADGLRTDAASEVAIAVPDRYEAALRQIEFAGQPMNWIRGGTWTHSLGANAKIGLVSMDGSGITADFDYIRVAKVQLEE